MNSRYHPYERPIAHNNFASQSSNSATAEVDLSIDPDIIELEMHINDRLKSTDRIVGDKEKEDLAYADLNIWFIKNIKKPYMDRVVEIAYMQKHQLDDKKIKRAMNSRRWRYQESMKMGNDITLVWIEKIKIWVKRIRKSKERSTVSTTSTTSTTSTATSSILDDKYNEIRSNLFSDLEKPVSVITQSGITSEDGYAEFYSQLFSEVTSDAPSSSVVTSEQVTQTETMTLKVDVSQKYNIEQATDVITKWLHIEGINTNPKRGDILTYALLFNLPVLKIRELFETCKAAIIKNNPSIEQNGSENVVNAVKHTIMNWYFRCEDNLRNSRIDVALINALTNLIGVNAGYRFIKNFRDTEVNEALTQLESGVPFTVIRQRFDNKHNRTSPLEITYQLTQKQPLNGHSHFVDRNHFTQIQPSEPEKRNQNKI